MSDLLQFCCHLLSPWVCHHDAQASVSREALTEHMPLQAHVRDPRAMPNIFNPRPPYAVSEVLQCIPPGMAGFGFNQLLQPIHLQVSNDHVKSKLMDF